MSGKGGARISEEAIQRNRDSSLRRYHKNKPHYQKVQKRYREEKLRERPFIGWDGEGYTDADGNHHYMLFGASTGDCITGPDLGTTECLELILKVAADNPGAFHVGFAFDYDVNMIFRDLRTTHRAILIDCNKCRWFDKKTGKRYRIEHIPHKWLRVSSEGVSATIHDTFGFFHTSYMSALEKYNIGDDAKRGHIRAGKDLRSKFTYTDADMVKAYWLDEISLFPPLMDAIRDAVYGGGYFISEWHGPGALATYLLRDRGVSKWHSRKTPPEVKSAFRYAYAGGRFTGALCGLYIGDIYTADINSAYVYACSLLPRMDRGKWVRQNPNDVDPGNLARFGLYRIEYEAGEERRNKAKLHGNPEPPYPLFCRSKTNVLRWPAKCTGWYWTPEADLVLGNASARVLEAWVFTDDGTKPFGFVHEAYNRRLVLQHEDNPAEKAYKWALAAMYGAFARRVGWDKETRKAPASHELAWAGYITSWCRAAVYGPALAAYEDGEGRGLISIDTDGITATVPFDPQHLRNGVGEGLGQWKLEKWSGILQWQNGIYWLRDSEGNWKDPKSRGIPKGSIPFDKAMAALEAMDYSHKPWTHPKIHLQRTRFIGYRQAQRSQFDKWRKWETNDYDVIMGGPPGGKAAHHFLACYACKHFAPPHFPARDFPPVKIAASMHTVVNMPDLVGWRNGNQSFPHKLPWLEERGPTLPKGFVPDEFDDGIYQDLDL